MTREQTWVLYLLSIFAVPGTLFLKWRALSGSRYYHRELPGENRVKHWGQGF